MVKKATRWGWRWECPEEGCTVVCWGGSTSRPADLETRRRRQIAHDLFDQRWKGSPNPQLARTEEYRLLALALGIPTNECHIGMMAADQLTKVIEYCNDNDRRQT